MLRKLSAILAIFLFLSGIGCDLTEQGRTPAQEFEHWTNLLGFNMLDVAQSNDWIKKHEDEISIPVSIDFKDYHSVSELDFISYGIIITADHNGKYRVGKRIGFRPEWPPDKTPLKIGDKLAVSFPVDIDIEWSGNSISEFKEFVKNRTDNFVFKAKEPYSYSDTEGFIVTYKSPKGATIYYNADGIITKIEGAVFKRQYNPL